MKPESSSHLPLHFPGSTCHSFKFWLMLVTSCLDDVGVSAVVVGLESVYVSGGIYHCAGMEVVER